MAYVLEPITPADIDKMISDTAGTPRTQGDLIIAKTYRGFPETWAIDRNRNYYFLGKPMPSLEQLFDRPYCIFARGQMYTIRVEGRGNRVYFDGENLPPAHLLAEVQDEIKAAFIVYGRWGTGPTEGGRPVHAVLPEFIVKQPGNKNHNQ